MNNHYMMEISISSFCLPIHGQGLPENQALAHLAARKWRRIALHGLRMAARFFVYPHQRRLSWNEETPTCPVLVSPMECCTMGYKPTRPQWSTVHPWPGWRSPPWKGCQGGACPEMFTGFRCKPDASARACHVYVLRPERN